MDFALDRFETCDVLLLLRKERIEHRLAFARRVEPPFDTELLDQLVEPERSADDADRADDRGGVAHDLVSRARDHVAARGGDVLDEGDHRPGVLLGKLADTLMDQMRLNRRAARRVDGQRHGGSRLHGEGALQRARHRREREPGLERRREADDAGQPHHRNDSAVAAQAARQHRGQEVCKLLYERGFSHILDIRANPARLKPFRRSRPA